MSEPPVATPGRVLITGAAGWVGHYLAEGLGHDQRQLRLLDTHPIDPEGLPTSAELITGSVTDADLLDHAMQGVDAVVHLGGIPKEAAFRDVVDVNVIGTQLVLETARRHGVARVVIASSNHAVGFQRGGPGQEVPDDVPGRPDTFYGWSKVAIEALADLYADRFGLSIVSVRIAQFTERCTDDARGMAFWLSPRDGVALFDAALTAPIDGHVRVWGASANRRSWFSGAGAAALGYVSVDDSERFAPEIHAATNGQIPSGTRDGLIGGAFCDAPLGEPMGPPVRPQR